MKIAWFCIPAHGHTNPTLGIVKKMTDAGHEVYYFSFECFREKIEHVGANFIPCDAYDFEMEDKENGDRVGKDMAFSTELLVSTTLALDEMVNEKISEIKPDLVVADSVAFWGKLTAIKYNIPFVSSTTTFAFNKYSARYMKQSIGGLFKMLFSIPKVKKQIKRLNEKGYPVKGIMEIVQNDNNTNTIVYTSKFFQPCADTFSEKYCFIGPSIRPVESTYEKTAKKTIYISMGTVVKNSDIYKNCIEALKNTDYQVIMSLGTNKQSFTDLPDNIQVYESVDQMAVLSIADAFITHCGMNSVSEALYFEVPLIMLPQTDEQGAVSLRAKELGAGVRLPSESVTDIREALNEVLHNKKYKEAATLISKSFKESGGAEKAKEFLESIGRKVER